MRGLRATVVWCAVIAAVFGGDGGTARGGDPRTPRLGDVVPPPFTARADDTHVWVAWAGRTVEVETTVVGGARVWQRAIELRPTHVEVRDTIANATTDTIGLHARHALAMASDDAAPAAGSVYVGGRADVTDAYDPWNPTIFAPVGSGGVGLVAEDDVLRQQLHVDRVARDHTVGLRTDMLCLAPGDRVTLVWSVYPTATGDYWDFINTVRRDWSVNRTVAGSLVWFNPDEILAMPAADLAAALGRRRAAIASMWGGWVDPHRAERPPTIGFGAGVLGETFADYRQRIAAAVAKLHAARPGLKVLLYFDAQRDTSPDATTRYADSVLRGRDGAVERVDWQHAFSPSWGMVPTTTNAYGRALRDVVTAMRALGSDGLYWDEMDGVDYARPRLTTTLWDRRSCVLGARGDVVTKVGLVNLLSEDAKLEYAADGLVLGNMPPTTRRFQSRPDLRIVEAQHNDTWGAFAHLTTPLGYLSAHPDWRTMLRKIDEGILPVDARLDDRFELNARLFPFTPERLQPGTMRGRERIVTTCSGTHGWTTSARDVRAYRYDTSGVEHDAAWPVRHVEGGTVVDVELAPGEAAVLERVE